MHKEQRKQHRHAAERPAAAGHLVGEDRQRRQSCPIEGFHPVVTQPAPTQKRRRPVERRIRCSGRSRNPSCGSRSYRASAVWQSAGACTSASPAAAVIEIDPQRRLPGPHPWPPARPVPSEKNHWSPPYHDGKGRVRPAQRADQHPLPAAFHTRSAARSCPASSSTAQPVSPSRAMTAEPRQRSLNVGAENLAQHQQQRQPRAVDPRRPAACIYGKA